MAKLLNLDKFISEDRFFKIADMTFRIPGLIPVETVLCISKMGQEAATDPVKTGEILSSIWNVLAPANTDKTEQDFKSHISTPMLLELLPYIFNDQGGEDVESGVVDLSKNVSGGAATT